MYITMYIIIVYDVECILSCTTHIIYYMAGVAI